MGVDKEVPVEAAEDLQVDMEDQAEVDEDLVEHTVEEVMEVKEDQHLPQHAAPVFRAPAPGNYYTLYLLTISSLLYHFYKYIRI